MAEMLRNDLLQKLYDIAEHQQRSINELVEDVISRYQAEDTPANSLARLATGGRDMPPIGNHPAISEQADAILKDEFADYLLKRMTSSDEENSD